MNRIPLFKPTAGKDELKEISEVFKSHWFTLGPKTVLFEKRFAKFIGTDYAVAVNSGSSGMYMSYKVLGIGPGDKIIIPAMTFAATGSSVSLCGAIPVLVDVEEKTGNIDPEKVREILDKDDRIKALTIVHLYGLSCDMEKMMNIVKEFDIKLVEDCAHSIGATYSGRKVGSFGNTASFSFYATKNITTGEGGMITTKDTEIAKNLFNLRNHYMTKDPMKKYQHPNDWSYDITNLGFNFRMSEISAAMGIAQLKKIRSLNSIKRKIAVKYNRGLKNVKGIVTINVPENCESTYYLYTIRVTDKYPITKNQLYKLMINKGITVGVHYSPLHFFTYYRDLLGHKKGDFPIAEKIFNETLTLPIYPSLKKKEIEYVISVIRNAEKISS